MSYVLNTTQASQQIILRSTDAIDTTPFHTFNLKHPIIARDDHHMLLHVARAAIPNSFYGVFDVNNVLHVTETLNGVEQSKRTITIAPGNYSGTRLATALQMLLRTGSTIDYTCTFDGRIMGKFTVSHSQSTSSFVLEFPTRSSARLFGFAKGTTASVTATSPMTSPNVADLAHTHSILIVSELASNSIITSRTMSNANVLCEVPIDVGSFEMINFDGGGERAFRLLLSTGRLDEIKLRLTDQDGHALDLNGLAFTITLEVSFIQKRPLELSRRMVRLTEQLVESQTQREGVLSIRDRIRLLKRLAEAKRAQVVKEAEQMLQIQKEQAERFIDDF